MTYKKPEVGDNKVIYKGKRYWLIEFIGNDEIGYLGKNDCQYLLFDKLYDAPHTTVKFENGVFKASLAFSHVDITYEFDSLEKVIKVMPLVADDYTKTCCG